MESKISMNEFIDPELGRMVAADSDDECTGCAYKHLSPACRKAPPCIARARIDKRNIIWIRAEYAKQAPKAVKLTDEQIEAIESAHWSGPGLGATFNREAFARAIEAEVFKANGLGLHNDQRNPLAG